MKAVRVWSYAFLALGVTAFQPPRSPLLAMKQRAARPLRSTEGGAQEQVTSACDYIQKIVDRVSAPREEKDDEYDEDIIVTDDEEVGEWEAQYKAPSAAINLADFPGFS